MPKAERRQQILTHARDVFAKRGYHAAKIDDIVAAAGIARGTFYLYFEDKRTIFEEIVDRTITRLGMAILRVDVQDANRSVAEQIRENIRRLVDMLLEDRATTKILLSDAVGVDPAFDRKLQSFYDEIANLLERSILEGQEAGVVVNGHPRILAYLTLGAMKELLFQIVLRGAEYEPQLLVDEIFAFLSGGYLRGTRATPEARAKREAARPKKTARR